MRRLTKRDRGEKKRFDLKYPFFFIKIAFDDANRMRLPSEYLEKLAMLKTKPRTTNPRLIGL